MSKQPCFVSLVFFVCLSLFGHNVFAEVNIEFSSFHTDDPSFNRVQVNTKTNKNVGMLVVREGKVDAYLYEESRNEGNGIWLWPVPKKTAICLSRRKSYPLQRGGFARSSSIYDWSNMFFWHQSEERQPVCFNQKKPSQDSPAKVLKTPRPKDPKKVLSKEALKAQLELNHERKMINQHWSLGDTSYAKKRLKSFYKLSESQSVQLDPIFKHYTDVDWLVLSYPKKEAQTKKTTPPSIGLFAWHVTFELNKSLSKPNAEEGKQDKNVQKDIPKPYFDLPMGFSHGRWLDSQWRVFSDVPQYWSYAPKLATKSSISNNLLNKGSAFRETKFPRLNKKPLTFHVSDLAWRGIDRFLTRTDRLNAWRNFDLTGAFGRLYSTKGGVTCLYPGQEKRADKPLMRPCLSDDDLAHKKLMFKWGADGWLPPRLEFDARQVAVFHGRKRSHMHTTSKVQDQPGLPDSFLKPKTSNVVQEKAKKSGCQSVPVRTPASILLALVLLFVFGTSSRKVRQVLFLLCCILCVGFWIAPDEAMARRLKRKPRGIIFESNHREINPCKKLAGARNFGEKEAEKKKKLYRDCYIEHHLPVPFKYQVQKYPEWIRVGGQSYKRKYQPSEVATFLPLRADEKIPIITPFLLVNDAQDFRRKRPKSKPKTFPAFDRPCKLKHFLDLDGTKTDLDIEAVYCASSFKGLQKSYAQIVAMPPFVKYDLKKENPLKHNNKHLYVRAIDTSASFGLHNHIRRKDEAAYAYEKEHLRVFIPNETKNACDQAKQTGHAHIIQQVGTYKSLCKKGWHLVVATYRLSREPSYFKKNNIRKEKFYAVMPRLAIKTSYAKGTYIDLGMMDSHFKSTKNKVLLVKSTSPVLPSIFEPCHKLTSLKLDAKKMPPSYRFNYEFNVKSCTKKPNVLSVVQSKPTSKLRHRR